MVRAAGETPGDQALPGTTGDVVRLRILCRGAVQGVGFRPSVHRLATSMGLAGWVRNGPEGASIELEGRRQVVASFGDRLAGSLPRLARLDDIEFVEIAPTGEPGFKVETSTAGQRERALAPPDSALCPDCRNDMEQSSGRRYRYPFTTCTNCGPRYSLVCSLPYDRERTSMACFPMCADCRREYEDSADRRFHAEPICCPACGPKLKLLGCDGAPLAENDDALDLVRRSLAVGKIVAVKGLGGFQLACRADDPRVVARLRERKRRPTKPFAIMVRDMAATHRIVHLSEQDMALLESSRSPILLAPRRREASVAEGIAPGIEDVGVMLPTTPLHEEIFRESDYDALVMTSANVSDEPICRGNREAVEKLGSITDLFLLHDRDVVRRVDDSVVRSFADRHVLIRRSRGYVPEPLPLPQPAPEPVLALGGHLQATACLAVADEAFFTPHIGDLDNEPARAFLLEATNALEEFLDARATTIVADLHPDYPSTWIAEKLASERNGRLLRIQHHLAHVAAVLAEHRCFPADGESVAGISLDGTGYGTDHTAWGGEWIVLGGDLTWRRTAHLEPIPLVGAEQAVREPWRVLCAALAMRQRTDLLAHLPLCALVGEKRLTTVSRLAGEKSWPLATGAGRIFEAAGSLLGLVERNSFEGEAAARLESLAGGGKDEPWPEVTLDDPALFPSSRLLVAAAERAAAGEEPSTLAAGFHATFCRLAVELTARVLDPATVVALGGGCMVNRLLLSGLRNGLFDLGFMPLVPKEVPPGDGGLSYGQLTLGTISIADGKEIRQL